MMYIYDKRVVGIHGDRLWYQGLLGCYRFQQGFHLGFEWHHIDGLFAEHDDDMIKRPWSTNAWIWDFIMFKSNTKY